MSRASRNPDDPRRQQQPPALSSVLRQLVERRGWERRLDGARVHERWEEIAGEQLARHVTPVRLHGGVLVVAVSSPAWATQVRYLAGDIVARANAVLGEGQVVSVTVTTRGR